MLFQRRGQLRPFGFLHRDEVLDGQGIEHLAAKTLGGDAGADAFTCGVNSRCRAGWPTADHQHIKGVLGVDLLGLASTGAGVDLAEDFFQAHTALAKHFTVQVDARHRHDLARFHFCLEQRTVDGHMAHIGVEHRHQVKRLNHIRAVLARQREVGFEGELAFQRLDLLDHFGTRLGRVAADLQQRQHQRGEFMAHGDAGKAQADLAIGAIERERWTTGVITIRAQSNQG